MAEVVPFLGTRYAIDKIGDLGKVLTPPYDVITPEMRDAFYEKDPLNFVRVDFGKELPGDDEFENKYTRAGALLQQWKNDGVLKTDDRRAFTVYEQAFTLPGGSEHRRRGIFGLVKLEDLGTGIHAHESTFDGPKSDRFKLLRSTETNTSPIFCLYKDAERRIEEIIESEISKPPWAEFSDHEGVRHRAWIVAHEKKRQAISEVLADKDLFIADGHHRYETSLLYRDRMRAQLKNREGVQPFDWTLMFLCNAEDEGTVIIPFHRALAPEMDDGVDPDEFFKDLEEFFTVKPVKMNLKAKGAGVKFAARVQAAHKGKLPTFGVTLAGGRSAILKLKPGRKRSELLGRKIPAAVRMLDVTVLHELILRQTWVGNPEIEFDDQDILYSYDPDRMLDLLVRRKVCAVFFLTATRIDQVMTVASEGLRMPHKSTCFYPKVISGLVNREMNLV